MGGSQTLPRHQAGFCGLPCWSCLREASTLRASTGPGLLLIIPVQGLQAQWPLRGVGAS